MKKEKIGLAVITFNRLSYLKQCIKALEDNNWGGARFKCVVDDGRTQEGYDMYLNYLAKKGIKVVTKKENLGVAHTKNTALQFMVENNCEHLFTIEDDILMKYNKTCIAYVDYAKDKKLQHLNFALHGPLNKGKKAYIGSEVCVYPDCVGAFSYYSKACIEAVGYMDENFHNVWEHVEHTYRCSLLKMTTPFWQFADHPLSDRMLDEIPGSIEASSIRPNPKWEENMINGKSYWISKWGSWLPPRPK